MIEAIEQQGLDPSAVLFVKRKGWLHVQLSDHVRSFAFHRKKRTVIDEEGRWQETVEYMIHSHGRAKEGLDLQMMIWEFKEWLKERPRSA